METGLLSVIIISPIELPLLFVNRWDISQLVGKLKGISSDVSKSYNETSPKYIMHKASIIAIFGT